uniref:soluble calcium-activated nucleotidase 1-like n=1 Tax=Styela clava TaxID=7725 RepID=UPI001939AABC|nr:soluble calcium-activated nucleotidase 1-like [Styela clava]
MEKYPATEPIKRGRGVTEFKIATVADLDKFATDKDEEGETVWKSFLAKGSLIYDEINRKVSVDMPENSGITVTSEFSRGGRGMELSALIYYKDKLYSVDDKTGIVFEIGEGKAIPRVILSDGDGNQAKGFKGEWLTTKDGMLYVGGHGREFVRNDGSILNKNYMWIKIVDDKGAVQHVNWCDNYNALRQAAGCPFPGYLIHEAAVWSSTHKSWFFLPRKVSKDPYDYQLDEQRAGNILLSCTDRFDDIKVVQIGQVNCTRGYSSFKFIPGTDDKVIVAVKSEEVGNKQKSFISAFTIEGEILLEDQEFADKKYEGIEFI